MQPAHSRWKFVVDRRKPVYRTLAAELDAIRNGIKPISFFATDKVGLRDDLAEIEPLAIKRDLRVTVAKRGKAIDIFVHREDSVASIAPLQKLLSRSPWSFVHEASLGVLLGYSPAQRAAWLAAEHHARPGFGVVTIYGMIGTGYRSPNWWWTEPGKVAAPDAYAKRPKGTQLWRVGLDPTFAKKLDQHGQYILANLGKRKAFARAARTAFERLGPKGWQYAAKTL